LGGPYAHARTGAHIARALNGHCPCRAVCRVVCGVCSWKRVSCNGSTSRKSLRALWWSSTHIANATEANTLLRLRLLLLRRRTRWSTEQSAPLCPCARHCSVHQCPPLHAHARAFKKNRFSIPFSLNHSQSAPQRSKRCAPLCCCAVPCCAIHFPKVFVHLIPLIVCCIRVCALFHGAPPSSRAQACAANTPGGELANSAGQVPRATAQRYDIHSAGKVVPFAIFFSILSFFWCAAVLSAVCPPAAKVFALNFCRAA
jgi:hypothetical protein